MHSQEDRLLSLGVFLGVYIGVFEWHCDTGAYWGFRFIRRVTLVSNHFAQ